MVRRFQPILCLPALAALVTWGAACPSRADQPQAPSATPAAASTAKPRHPPAKPAHPVTSRTTKAAASAAAARDSAAITAPSFAATPAAPATPPGQAVPPNHPLALGVPVFSPTASSPYNFNVAPAQVGPPGTITMTSASPLPDYSFQQFAHDVHGYASAGVSSNNGHMFSGGVTAPLVPGKADVFLNATTGQFGNLPAPPGVKPGTLNYTAYGGGIAIHPTDDFSAFIGIQHVQVGVKQNWGYPYGP